MTADEIVRLKVGVTGADSAEKKLQALDTLVQKLNNSSATINVHTNITAAMQALEKNVEAVQQNIAANAALIQSGNALAAAEMKNAKEIDRARSAAEGNTQVTEKMERVQSELVAALEQTAQAQAKQSAASIQAQAATLQEADAKEKLVKVEINVAESAERTAEASAKELDAKAKLVRAESALAVAREKSYQEAQKTQQAIEKTAQAEARQATAAIQQTVSEQARMRRGFEVLGSQILRAVTRNIREATDELKAMNAEMVSIQKVTGATDADMERLKNSAFEVAGALGSTPSDYLSSVTKWAQAGYGALSEQLGELSAKTQVVGDVNEETANKFLLAVDAAYKYKGNIDALTRVLDGANEISNNYATEVDKLANGMGIVSSLAEQAGMKVEETMAAIGTITAKTRESGNSAARALRALILNIQGSTEIEIDAETGERWTEDEIQRTAVVLGKLNIATREYKDGIMQLRNPMEAIGELAKKYRDGLVTEAQLQEVVSSLGGKVRSNQLMALIQGYETYTSMIETYKDAVGSADNELQIYLNGWEAKSKTLMNQWTQFVESFKASDISMTALDLASAVMDIANTPAGKILAVAAAMAALNAAMKTDKGAAVLGVLSAVPKGISNISGEAKKAAQGLTGLTAILHGAKGGVLGFTQSLYSVLGPIGLTVVGITALVAILKLLKDAYEEVNPPAKKLWENAKKSAEEYQTLTQEAEQLREQLKNVGERMDELNKKGPLTLTERAELERLEITNSQLKTQLELKERLAKLAQDEAIRNATAAFNKGFSDENGNAEKFFGSEFLGKSWDKQIKEVRGALGLYTEILQNAQEEGNKWAEDSAQKAVDSIQKVLGEMGTELGNQFAMIDGLDTDKAVELMEQINEVSMKLQAISDPMQAAADALERFQDGLDPAALQKFNAELEKMRGDGKVTSDEITVLAKLFPELQTIMDITGLTAEQLAEHFNAATKATRENTDAAEENANAQEKETEEWEKVASTLKKYADRAQDVMDAQEELKRNGELSFNTLIGLLGKYGNEVNDVVMKALDGRATQEEIFKALEIAYEHDVKAYREAMLEKEMDNEDYYASWLAANTDTVNKLLTQYGIDAANYKTLAQLKKAIESGTQTDLTNIERGGANDRIKIFGDIQTAFEHAQDAMVLKAQSATGVISGMYGALAGAFGKFGNWLGGLGDQVSGFWGKVKQNLGLSEDDKNNALDDIMGTFTPPPYTGSSASSRGSGGSGKSWYETQTDNLNKLVEQTKRTNQVLERSDQDTAQARVDNLKKVQDQILAAQKQFIARGLAENSDEVNQLKLMYAGLGDDIRDIWSGMTDHILEQHDYLIWAFEKKGENPRSMEAMAQDDADMVQQYRKMQEEVHQLANHYRAQGVREEDKLIRDLQDKWWEYENAIRDMYSNLSDAFNDYIDESSHKIEELGRTTGNVGKQIELYAQRIQRAQETIAALEKNNINGALNGQIFDLESQIWGDKDSIRDLQEGLWDELERAFDDIFDKAQADVDAIGDEIEAIQDQMDGINDILEEYDKELEGILKPINDTLEKLNDQLEAEKKRLEERTQPLEDRRQGLEDQISGYYTINPDGSIGPYIEGLDDSIDEIQDQIDKANEELDRVNDAWNEQKDREEEALALQKKQLAVEEAQKAVEEALLALQTARNERNIYTLKDGVWAWRADEEAVAKAEKALADAEKAKEEAEKDLQDYKEEQAHKQIVKRLEEQIKALEDQKKLLDKQKDLINKQIDALNKQIKAYERESQARQDYIQDMIDRKEEEKKAWEDHYEALKEQYNDQLSALEQEKKLAEERKNRRKSNMTTGWIPGRTSRRVSRPRPGT